MLTATALAFIVNIAGAVLNWTAQRLGRRWTQAILFVAALVAATWAQYGTAFPAFQEWLGAAVVIFSMAIAFYEVLLKYFPAFSGPK